MRVILLAAFAAAVLVMCGAPRQATARPHPAAPAPAQEITLKAGESAGVGAGGFTLVFERVESDSRCPEGARCVWAGDAIVRLAIEERDTSESRTIVRLHTNPRGTREVRHANVRIRLVSLEPRPTLDREIDPAEYRVRLSVAEDPGP